MDFWKPDFYLATKKASEHVELLTSIDVAKRNLTDEPMEQEQAPLATPTRRSSRLDSGSPVSTPGGRKSNVKEAESASMTRSGRKAGTPGTPKGKKISPSTPARRASRRISGRYKYLTLFLIDDIINKI